MPEVKFLRDSAGKVTGVTFGGNRVSGVHFVRRWRRFSLHIEKVKPSFAAWSASCLAACLGQGFTRQRAPKRRAARVHKAGVMLESKLPKPAGQVTGAARRLLFNSSVRMAR